MGPKVKKNKKTTTTLQKPRPLTRQDEHVLSFIRSYQLKEGCSPSREEIARELELPHLMAAQRSIQKLRENGRLDFEKNSKRGLVLTESLKAADGFVELPLLGNVAAGRPIEAIEGSDKIQVPQSMVRGHASHFTLRVKGSSMIDEHICDGDFVVIREQKTANNGDKVVALIDNEATLKSFYLKNGRVELHPANEALSPIIVESHQHLRIAGIYVGLIRVVK